jgi:hypothetical protein
MKTSYCIRTKMADAFLSALYQCTNEGHSAGRIGRDIVTADSRGLGIKYKKTVIKSIKAESAVIQG